MKDTQIIDELLNYPVLYYPALARVTGSINASILFSQVRYWSAKKKGGLFYKTDKEFCQELSMGAHQLRDARKKLIELGVIKIQRWGGHIRMHYLYDEECLQNLISIFRKSEDHVTEIGTSSSENRKTRTETTTYTTTDTPSTNVEGLASENRKPSQEERDLKKLTQLPLAFGKQPLHRIVTAYNILWYDLYGTSYKADFGMVGRLFKPLLAQLTEWQIFALFFIHFDWRGANDDDDSIYKRLDAAMFPIAWVPSAINQYSTFITNFCQVPFDDKERVRDWVQEQTTEQLQRAVEAGIIKTKEEK